MKLNLQNAASPLIEQLNFFHDWVMVFVVGIAGGVIWYLALIPVAKPGHRRLLDAQSVECG